MYCIRMTISRESITLNTSIFNGIQKKIRHFFFFFERNSN
jgi:hypothetical protein